MLLLPPPPVPPIPQPPQVREAALGVDHAVRLPWLRVGFVHPQGSCPGWACKPRFTVGDLGPCVWLCVCVLARLSCVSCCGGWGGGYEPMHSLSTIQLCVLTPSCVPFCFECCPCCGNCCLPSDLFPSRFLPLNNLPRSPLYLVSLGASPSRK